MLKELSIKIAELDLDVLITFITTFVIFFFGITTNVRNKQFRLKNILVLYISLFICLVFTSNPWVLFIFLTLGVLAGGIIFLHDKENDLEKELNIIFLIPYYSISWFFYNKTYIWIISTLVVITFLNNNISEKYIIITIGLFLIYHYCTISINFFDYHNFEKAFSFLKISFAKSNSEETAFENEDYNQAIQHTKLISFMLYMEDKNMFNRDTPHINFKTDFIESKFKNKNQIFNGIKLNTKTGIKRYLRGYSTIEQQYFRQRILKDNSYRYKIRRTLFITLYTKLFFRAVCAKRAKSFSRNSYKRIKYAKKLRKNLKYHILMSYYIDVHKNPKTIDTLIKSMAKESRISELLYYKLYERFKGSNLEQEYINIIEKSKENTENGTPITFNLKKI